MEASEAKANCKHIKEDLDNGSCIKPITKRSNATTEVNTLDTMDSNIKAGQTEDPKTAIEVIDNTWPFQQEVQQPQVISRPNVTALKDPLCVKLSLSSG